MGRPRAFDAGKTMKRVMEVFWRQGFAATSISDLEQATGVGRKSLYDSFGDKEALFRAALDLYLTAPIPIARPDAGLPEIRATFLKGPFFRPPFHSCLVVDTIVERGRSAPPRVRQRTALHIDRLRAGFERALLHDGDAVVPEDDLPAVAEWLTSNLLGLSVMAASGADDETLHRIAEQTLTRLDRTEESS